MNQQQAKGNALGAGVCTNCGENPCRGLMRCGATAKPRVELQGKAVVERDGDALLVMLPDGEIVPRPTARAADILIRRWFKARALDVAINVGLTEWRDGIRPPSEE